MRITTETQDAQAALKPVGGSFPWLHERTALRQLVWPILRTWLLVVVLIVVVGSHLYLTATTDALADLRRNNVEQVSVAAESVTRVPDDLVADIQALSRHPSLRRYADSPTPANRAALEQALQFFAETQRSYQQVRWLSPQGMERVRVDLDGGNAVAVAVDALQDKSDRYYLLDSRAVSVGEVYVSRLDLNIEHGEIEYPRRPTLRLVMPIAGSDGARSGLLVLNYQAQAMIDAVRSLGEPNAGRLLWVNGDGYFVIAPDPARDWAFMHADLQPRDRLGNHFPLVAAALSSADNAEIESPAGLFAVREIRFAPESLPSHAASRCWLLIGWVTPMAQASVLAALRRQAIVSGALLIFLALIGSASFTLLRNAARVRRDTEALSRERLHAVLLTASDGIVTIDAAGTIQSFNLAAERIFGWREEELAGEPVTRLMPDSIGARHDGFVQHYLDTGERHVIGSLREVQAMRRDGSVFPAELSVTDSIVGGRRLFTGFIRDITLRQQIEAKVKHQSLYDDLTGLPNRRMLLIKLSQSIASAARRGEAGGLLLIDLDHFKLINDALGHTVGDNVLKELASRLSDRLRVNDLVTRLGGDEFAIVLDKLHMQESEAAVVVHELAQGVAAAIAQPVLVNGAPQTLTASIGVVLFPLGDSTADTLLKHADTALNRAKSGGRNTIRFFRPSMEAEVSARLQLIGELRRAIAHDELTLHYQPKIDATSQRCAGVEALIRWQHPVRGLLAPDRFIGFAEEVGLINEIGGWTIRRAIDDMCRLQAELDEALPAHVAINISPRHFFAPGFVAELRDVIERSGFPAHRIELEITENLMLDNVDLAVRKMHGLGELGVTLALDDFGTGFSSLNYLRSLPVDRIKIDRSFVTDVDHEPAKAAMVETILSMRKVRLVAFVAEGVETFAERDWLMAHGCDAIQGYLFCRPVPLEQLATYCRDDVDLSSGTVAPETDE